MLKIKKLYLKLTLVSFVLLNACVANSQQGLSTKVNSETPSKPQSKHELAKEVLTSTGIAEKYNLYLGNSLDISLSSTKPKFRQWMQSVLLREAGWAKIEDKYIARLETSFSESELKELLNLSERPLVKKLLQDEIQAYTDVSEERRKLLFKVWDDYNSGIINPPSELLK
jgi:hypothetical protein